MKIKIFFQLNSMKETFQILASIYKNVYIESSIKRVDVTIEKVISMWEKIDMFA